jgi:hypothetical protein
LVEALIVSIVIAGISGVSLLNRCLPMDWVQPTRPYEQLKAELRTRIWLSKVSMVGVVVFAALAATFGFESAQTVVRHPVPGAAFIVRPSRAVFALPGLFIGIAVAGLLEVPIDRWISKEKYWDCWFVDYRNRNRRARPPTARNYLWERRAMAFLIPIMAAMSLIFSFLAFDAYAYVTPSKIVVNPFFGFQEHHHLYTDVQSISTRLIGKRRDQLECQILFKDRSILSTDAPPSRLTNSEVEALGAYVFERTTVPWTHDP